MTDKKSPPYRSPLKQAPLPIAGRSGQHALVEFLDNELLTCIVMPALFAMWMLVEWVVWFSGKRLHPLYATALFAIVAAYGLVRLRKSLKKADAMGRGVQGERVVGARLEELRELGYKVLHDVPETGFNIDHVLVGPGGIFAIETKTISKPTDHDAQVVVDGDRLLVDGRTLDRGPIKQATAQADAIAQLLAQICGSKPYVRPVVVFPGWYVKLRARPSEVWVLNENSIGAFIANEHQRLSKEQIVSYTEALSTMIRARLAAGA
jgi:hypothetical protein